jgi:hypothetical protein
LPVNSLSWFARAVKQCYKPYDNDDYEQLYNNVYRLSLLLFKLLMTRNLKQTVAQSKNSLHKLSKNLIKPYKTLVKHWSNIAGTG